MLNRPPLSAGPGEAKAPAPKSLRILIVDDERDTVLTLMTLLRQEGHVTTGLYKGAEVMNALAHFDADAVILDIGLPDRNGYDLAREIRSRYGEHRPMLLAVTAWNKSSDRMLAEMAGFDHHIPKPYDPNRVIALLAPLRLQEPNRRSG